MKKLVITGLFLILLSVSFIGCRSKQPCPTYMVDESQAEEVITEERDI